MWQNNVGQNDEKTIRDNGVDGVSWQLVSPNYLTPHHPAVSFLSVIILPPLFCHNLPQIYPFPLRFMPCAGSGDPRTALRPAARAPALRPLNRHAAT